MNRIGPPLDKTYRPLSLPFKRLVLTGFMGSGKTTVGRLLAGRLDWGFVDLDTEIERRARRTVADIFTQSGEPFFRSLETDALRSSLLESGSVIALGGGAVETPANSALLVSSSGTFIILLTAPFDTLYQRCIRQASNPKAAVRPLLGDSTSAAERLNRRDNLYRKLAGLVVDSSGQSPRETVESILQSLRGTL